MKDFYKVLGLQPTASDSEIKRTFKDLAKRHHPDRNKGNPKSEEKFKEISEAYEVLGNPESRKKYDEERELLNHPGFSSRGSPFSGFGNVTGDNAEDFFSQFAKSRFQKERGGFGGLRDFADFFSENVMRDEPQSATLRIPLKIACAGGDIQVSGLPGEPQNISIPAGTEDGAVFSVNTSQGPFRLRVAIEDSPPFKIRGKDIELTISINIAQAVLGSKVKIQDPRGDSIILSVPQGSQHGKTLRLKNLGLGGGALLVRVEIQIPEKLSEQERELFVQFAKTVGLKF